jgi:hypothetical protein
MYGMDLRDVDWKEFLLALGIFAVGYVLVLLTLCL